MNIANNIGISLPVDEVLGVDELELVEELDGQHQHRLQRELATADVEQVFQRWPKQLNRMGINLSLQKSINILLTTEKMSDKRGGREFKLISASLFSNFNSTSLSCTFKVGLYF